MKQNYIPKALLAIMLSVLLPLSFYGQDEGKSKKNSGFTPQWFIPVEGGVTMFHGDANRYYFAPDFEKLDINGKIGFGRQFTPVFKAYAKVGFGQFVSGNSRGGTKDGVSGEFYPFENKLFQQNVTLEEGSFGAADLNIGFNVWNLIFGYKSDRVVTLDLHAGVGLIHYKSKTNIINGTTTTYTTGFTTDSDLNDKGDGINGRVSALNIPVGGEFNFKLSERFDLFADYTFNFVGNDKMDGIVEPDGTYKDDMYGTMNVGARFKFPAESLNKMVEEFGDVELNVDPDPLEERADSVEVNISGSFPPKYFNKNAVMCFQPKLVYEGGETPLKAITFKGDNVTGDGILISNENGGSFTYTDKIPYDPKYRASELVVEPVIYSYKGEIYEDCNVPEDVKHLTAPQRKLADGVINTSERIVGNGNHAMMDHKYNPNAVVTTTSDIYFQKNKSNLNWNVKMNKTDAAKEALETNMDRANNGYMLKSIAINGWASPEGEETFNEGLSEKRAATAESYLKKKINKMLKDEENGFSFESAGDIQMSISGNGPDWNGFMTAVETSDMGDKNAILNVVRSADYSKREEEIRNMILIYPELEEDILPPLRRAIISVNTSMFKYAEEELIVMAKGNSGDISLEEYLFVAEQMDDLNDKKMVYENTLNHYPKCARAHNNLAAVEMKLGNWDKAKQHVAKAEELSEGKMAAVYVNKGVLAWHDGDKEAAKKHFDKAESLGGDLRYNMGIYAITKGNYSAAEKMLRGFECDYNLGLAQTLNGNYDAAKNTLACAEQNAETHYLQAIVAARMDDASKVYEHLGRAIQMDASYKEEAMWDREFIDYFDTPEFKALVQ